MFTLNNISKNTPNVQKLIKAHAWACLKRHSGQDTCLIVLGQYTEETQTLLRNNIGSIIDVSLEYVPQITAAMQKLAGELNQTSRFGAQLIRLEIDGNFEDIHEAVNRYFYDSMICADGDEVARNFIEQCRNFKSDSL